MISALSGTANTIIPAMAPLYVLLGLVTGSVAFMFADMWADHRTNRPSVYQLWLTEKTQQPKNQHNNKDDGNDRT